MKNTLKLMVALAAAGTAFVPALPASATGSSTLRPYHEKTVVTGTFECFDANCDVFELNVSGGGTASHLGRFTQTAFEGGAPYTYYSYTSTGRDGSSWSGVVDGYLDASDVECGADELAFKTYEHFTGGTGRFANITGNYQSEACFLINGDPTVEGGAPVVLRFTNSGVIGY
jgi:hypothetical protein